MPETYILNGTDGARTRNFRRDRVVFTFAVKGKTTLFCLFSYKKKNIFYVRLIRVRTNMTAFAKSDIPDEIDTVEKLAVWTANLLAYLYPDMTAIESSGGAVRVASANPFYITASDPPIHRHISRLSIPLDKDWLGANNQMWNFAKNLGTVAIPASFKN